MAEYLIQSETLDAIADAIHAKSGSPTPMTPAEMVTEIAAIPSGGSLPSSISRIDGGEFTFATDTAIQQSKITHSLGVVPKGFAIWSEEVATDQSAHTNQALAFSLATGVEWNKASGGNTTGYCYTMWKKTDANIAETVNSAMTVSATQIAPAGFYYWRGGATYKWLAWA